MNILTSLSDVYSTRIHNLDKESQRLGRLMNSNGIDGRYSDLRDTTSFIQGETLLVSVTKYEQDNKYLLERQHFMNQQLVTAQEINDTLGTIVRQAKNSNLVPDYAFRDKMTACLCQLTQVLNDRFIGETTMAGTGGRQAAVSDLTILTTLSAGSSADYSYYIGGGAVGPIALDETFTVDASPFSAKHPAIEKTIRACRIALSANPMDPFDPALESALNISDDARLTDYPAAVALGGSAAQLIDQHLQRLDQQKETYIMQAKISGTEDLMSILQQYQENRASLEISQSLMMDQINFLREFIHSMG